jgi:hypothetical protein
MRRSKRAIIMRHRVVRTLLWVVRMPLAERRVRVRLRIRVVAALHTPVRLRIRERLMQVRLRIRVAGLRIRRRVRTITKEGLI